MLELHEVLASRPGFIENVVTAIDGEFVLSLLRQIADAPAPSGTSSITRGPVVQAWCESLGLLEPGRATLVRNAFDSGGDILSFGNEGIAILAHLDEVSYLFKEVVAPGLSRIVPYCYHLATQPAPARILRFSADSSWQILCDAEVRLEGGTHLASHPTDIELKPSDRIVLAAPLGYDSSSGKVTGSLDNAAGATASLIASAVMVQFGIPFSIYLTDEEEGPSGAASQTISRGAARILSRVEPARLTVVVDIHGLEPTELENSRNHTLPWGASLAEYSSDGRGSVARPDILAALTNAFDELAPQNIVVRHNIGGHVPRSDDVVAMLRSNRVIVMGYPGMNRHFDHGLPTVNLADLVNLARALVVMGAMVAPVETQGKI